MGTVTPEPSYGGLGCRYFKGTSECGNIYTSLWALSSEIKGNQEKTACFPDDYSSGGAAKARDSSVPSSSWRCGRRGAHGRLASGRYNTGPWFRFEGYRGNIQVRIGGADGIRTHDLLDAIEARSQLRHGPTGSELLNIIIGRLRASIRSRQTFPILARRNNLKIKHVKRCEGALERRGAHESENVRGERRHQSYEQLVHRRYGRSDNRIFSRWPFLERWKRPCLPRPC
jgi:hypothetical protein